MDLETISELINSGDIDKIANLMKAHRLISSTAPYCKKDNKLMKWDTKASLTDKYIWRCSTCGCSKSIRYNSFFSEFDVGLVKMLKIFLHWCFQMFEKDIKDLVGVSIPTISKISQRLRLICLKDFDKANIRLGGDGLIVEIDESLFIRVKHHKGKDLKREQIWVFGVYERESHRCLSGAAGAALDLIAKTNNFNVDVDDVKNLAIGLETLKVDESMDIEFVVDDDEDSPLGEF
ncbi:transposase [Brachionus plicatilis]|uniref:Transposase n=1 Tax=Brachionus plicatilis TaxID=10195 RepID=A0A3M7RG15_BRAPC|nr:transposase [Brachionus plicatilis]